MAKGFKKKNDKGGHDFIPTEQPKGVGSGSIDGNTEVSEPSFEKQGKSVKSTKHSLPESYSPEWNKMKDDVHDRFNHDFNEIRFENLQKVNPNWFEDVITCEPSLNDLKDHFGEMNLSDEEFKKKHDEDELDDAKMEVQDSQREIIWSTLFEAKDSMLAEKITSMSDEIINDIGLVVIDMSNSDNADAYETGVFLGVNGAGYDFYEQHWIPLYRLFGWV